MNQKISFLKRRSAGGVNCHKGQAIAEVLIALAIGTALVVVAAGGIAVFIRQNHEIRTAQVAVSLAQEYFDALRSMFESDWGRVYNLDPKGPDSAYHLEPFVNSYSFSPGPAEITRENQVFNISFSILNVLRDSCGTGKIADGSPGECFNFPGSGLPSDTALDPLTQKVTVTVRWSGREYTGTQYIMRARNKVFVQSDWSGGQSSDGPFTSPVAVFSDSNSINYAGSGSISVSAPPSGSLASSVFGVFLSSTFNSISWQKNFGEGTVKFQFASSNCLDGGLGESCAEGEWIFMGPDGTDSTYYGPAGPGVPVILNPAHHSNKQYFRYKIFLDMGSVSPQVDDVIVNYSN